MRRQPTEKGKMEINGHQMSWEMIRSRKPSVFGIQESRIHELNLYRDGTMVADYKHKWLKVPASEDEETSLCLGYLLERYGKERNTKAGKEDKDD